MRHVHACNRHLFVFRSKYRRSVHPRSAPIRFRVSFVFSRTRAFWFLLWWLFLHRRLRLRQTRLNFHRATALPQRLIKSSKRHPFLSGRSGNFSTSLASLSASAWGVNSNFKSACCCSQTARHRTARLSPRRSRSHEKRDGMRVIHVA